MKKLFGPCLAGVLAALLLCSAGAATVRSCSAGPHGPGFRSESRQVQQTLQQLLQMPVAITVEFEKSLQPKEPAPAVGNDLSGDLQQMLQMPVVEFAPTTAEEVAAKEELRDYAQLIQQYEREEQELLEQLHQILSERAAQAETIVAE